MDHAHSDFLDRPIILRFPHSKEDLRKIIVKDNGGDFYLYRLMPVVADWPADLMPDRVNPRSHDTQCLKSKVARDIETTLRDNPEDFWLANRGGYVLAHDVKFDPKRDEVEITITELDMHGIADGGTTNAVIKKLQEEYKTSKDSDLRVSLRRAKFNVDVVVGLTDRDRIDKLVQGRNRSVQVRDWSLADFGGDFDWMKELIDRDGGPFKGRIGWDENSGKEFSVLDLISLMTLFNPVYDDPTDRRRKAPTVAYSSKGTADRRLIGDSMKPGFEALKPVIEDILRLHEYIYSQFHPAYERYNKEVYNRGAKLASRRGFDKRSFNLPLTGTPVEYKIDKGVLFPLLASFRALLAFESEARWKVEPQAFFESHSTEFIAVLMEQYELCKSNPVTTGKTRAVYTTLHDRARLLLSDSQG